jgi:predicted metal-dependent phosphoesterase TrpH
VKCDLHIHSAYSGNCITPFLRNFCRECYSEPEFLYSVLRRRGMDLVTLTDHDSIKGAEKLRARTNFFVSEELTCRMPSGTEIHIGVYDITEHQHHQLQQRRDDLVALLMYLTERRLFFSVNHVFSCLTKDRHPDDFTWFREYFPSVESRNGHMLPQQNESAARIAQLWDKIETAGSDAHVPASAATAYTEVPGARTKEEFFDGLRAGKGRVAGEAGNYWKLTRDVLLIGIEMMKEKHWTALLAPLACLVPAATFLNYRAERKFGERWAAEILGHPQLFPRLRKISASRVEEYA